MIIFLEKLQFKSEEEKKDKTLLDTAEHHSLQNEE